MIIIKVKFIFIKIPFKQSSASFTLIKSENPLYVTIQYFYRGLSFTEYMHFN